MGWLNIIVYIVCLLSSFLPYLMAAFQTPSLGMTQPHFFSKGYFTLAIRKDMDLVCSLAIHYLGKSLSISREVQEL